ncbi:unnamed protein product [Closterium sp. Naga37s-1]|nr:unnamed protein product [Closterium sp. Naga37s-1]
MELRLVNGMVLKVQLEEMAGGVGERVAALEAKLKEQGDAMATLKRDMAEMRSAMAHLKGTAATGVLAEKSEGAEAGKGLFQNVAWVGSASGEAAEGVGAQPLKGARGNSFAALELEGVKAQLEAATGEASEMRGEMGALKAELARMRAAAERQAAEVAYVKATAAPSEARINDVELALAALKDGRAEKNRDERKEGTAGEHAGAERREEKRRKRDEAGKEEEMVDAPLGVCPLIAVGGAPEGKGDAAEREGDEQDSSSEEENDEDCEDEVQGLRTRVEALETTCAGGNKIWEALMEMWSKFFPGETSMDLGGVYLSDAALTQVASLRSLTWLSLHDSSGFTAAGVTCLFSLTGLTSYSQQQSSGQPRKKSTAACLSPQLPEAAVKGGNAGGSALSGGYLLPGRSGTFARHSSR